MKSTKLCAAATVLAVVTATVSLTANPPEAQAAEQSVREANATEVAVLPAMALAAAAGTAGAFLLGIAQGYLEAKNAQNEQKNGAADSSPSFMDLSPAEFDYVLN